MEEKEIEQFGKGALHAIDDRDFIPAFGALKEFDWSKAKDMSEIAIVKDQGSSLSCTGQATAGVVGEKELGRRVSARSVYCQVALPQGGAYVRDAMDIGAKQILPFERDFPSYPNTEENLRDANGLIKTPRSLDWVYVSLRLSVESLANAIENYGPVSIAFYGTNRGWSKPDIFFDGTDWAHNVIGWRPVLRDNKKTIKIKNSWSDRWGNNGYGYIDDEYLKKAGICAYAYVSRFIKPIKYELKNKNIAKALWFLPANKNYINALYVERYNRPATAMELKRFERMMVKDAANIILGAWRSPYFGATLK